MNAKAILAIAALAVAASTGARADSDNVQQHALKFEGSRTRAEVKAEAIAAVKANQGIVEYAGSEVMQPIKSTVDVKAVRAEAVQAARQSQNSWGDTGPV